MKEAAGEANLTVVAIILIAVVVAVATPLINRLMSSSAAKSCCTDSGGVWNGGHCEAPANDTTGQYDAAAGLQCCNDANGNNCAAAFPDGGGGA